MERFGGQTRNAEDGRSGNQMSAELDAQAVIDRAIAVEEALQSSREKRASDED